MIPGVQKPHCDAPVATNASTSPSRVGVGQTGERGDRPARDPRRGRHAGDARVAVDEHRAAAALPLRRAAVLDRRDPEPLAQDRQERFAVGDVELDGLAVEGERESGQLNDWPQPQVRSAFGLLMWNPEPWRPSR